MVAYHSFLTSASLRSSTTLVQLSSFDSAAVGAASETLASISSAAEKSVDNCIVRIALMRVTVQ